MTGKKKTNLPPLMVEKVSAGFPSPAQQYLESPLDLNELMVPHPTGTYFVRVDGDSMINAGIHHNDILVVDCTLDPANGSIVVARVNGEALVKYFRRDRNGVRLEAANPAYLPIRFSDGMTHEIFGVVTGVIRQVVQLRKIS